jgi:glycosyltransferase involved in cell wall biosynthesis
MNKQHRVSVIIPTYNHAQYLGEAIESVLTQDYPDMVVIVVDDGSTDNTREVTASYRGKIISVEQPNGGCALARNTGLNIATGEYIAFLDSDDSLLPGSLRIRAEYLDNHPEAGLVCGDVIEVYGEGDHRLKSLRVNPPKHPDNFRWETVEFCATTSSVMARRTCFETAGKFEATLRQGQDWHMWVRLALHTDMVYLPFPMAYYKIHDSNVTLDLARVNHYNRMASRLVVDAPYFKDYPAHFRAKALYYRFATAWRTEPKHIAFRFLLRAVLTDPAQIPFGLSVIKLGITKAAAKAPFSNC